MGFWDFLLRRRKSFNQSEQSIDKSINQSTINQSIDQIDLERGSLQLGIAAGYTAKTLKSIENSLERIELGMINKEWLLNTLNEHLIPLAKKLEEHELNSEKRLQTLIELINSIYNLSQKVPEPLKKEFLSQIRKAENQLTPKMKQLVSIVKETKEISYTDLATKLSISESALRGLLTLTIRRGAPIERVNTYGRGWVRYRFAATADQSVNQSQNIVNSADSNE